VAKQVRLLTPRELQIVHLISQGLGNRDIGETLNLTEGTVKAYLHKMFRKTGVANRTELAVRAKEWRCQR
jgi:DNA-binding NarL/FixJ family response regulator